MFELLTSSIKNCSANFGLGLQQGFFSSHWNGPKHASVPLYHIFGILRIKDYKIKILIESEKALKIGYVLWVSNFQLRFNWYVKINMYLTSMQIWFILITWKNTRLPKEVL